MQHDSPSVIVLAGPNGAGKSTISTRLLAGKLGVYHFVNADTIARGLSAFHFDDMAIKAGRVMLEHLKELAASRANFAFETTLASKTFAPMISAWKALGYRFYLFFLWIPSPEMCIGRVSERVRLGGHGIPEDTIRRRYQRGIENFFHLYMPLADSWHLFDNSNPNEPRLIAQGFDKIMLEAVPSLWMQIKARAES